MTHQATETVHIDLGDRAYPIHIGTGLLTQTGLFADLPKASLALVVTNTTVGPLYLERLQSQLRQHYARVEAVVLPDGEAHKHWQTLQLIFDALLTHGADRKTTLFALGGGVVGDMTGFAASAFMRGVPFVQVPTTLLSQVDSSVGGKTGINHPLGKNMIGAFYQPLLVLCDLSTLLTLPAREHSAGLAEVIKYGPIADMAFFDWLEANMDGLVARDEALLAYAVKRSCEIKAHVVAADEKEANLRAILNFGHTFGHAIEAGMGYGQWLHGEAVAAGMVLAAQLSRQLGLVDDAFVNRLVRLIERAGLPIQAPLIAADVPSSVAAYLQWMRGDKKSSAGQIQYVLIETLGRAVMQKVDDAMVADLLTAALQAATAVKP